MPSTPWTAAGGVGRVVVRRHRVAAAATTDLPYDLPHAHVGAAADKGSEQEDKGSRRELPGPFDFGVLSASGG
ncbi:hypothetical protein GCM10018775_92270 [Streptomyces umbrinus]|nr:hypothetical protein GCM10018775_92270 [Streptomyces umbrinus]